MLFLPLEKGADNYLLIFVALAIGSAIGLVASKRVAMTDMPQMVSVFNGLGGACAVAISVVEEIAFWRTVLACSSIQTDKYSIIVEVDFDKYCIVLIHESFRDTEVSIEEPSMLYVMVLDVCSY